MCAQGLLIRSKSLMCCRVNFGDIYRFEIMILVYVKAKSLLCYWAVRDLDIYTVNMEMKGLPNSCTKGLAASFGVVKAPYD